ncbi:MAG: PorT family protein [Calditrichaeota bacterium]|nr:MAG: PorT family protein [Calditrichota bacterium]
MKKRYLFFISMCLIILLPPAYAREGKFQYGLRAGLGLSSMNENIISPQLQLNGVEMNLERNHLVSGTGGAFLEYWFTSNLALQVNVLYLQKGVRVESNFEGAFFDNISGEFVNTFGNTSQDLHLRYLSFPLMVKFNFPGANSATLKPFFLAGPEVAYLLSARTSSLEGEMAVYIPATWGEARELFQPGDEQTDRFQRMEVGFNFGGGITFPMGASSIFLDGWYNWGITSPQKEGEKKAANRVITVNLGILF